MEKLKGIKVAILATNGFEESELFEPMEALREHGAEIEIISPEKGKIKAWKHGEWSRELNVDVVVSEASAGKYDVLVIPGGVINPDKLRRDSKSVEFVKEFFKSDKMVASICHGPQLLIEADAVKGRKLTSFFSIKKDLVNAGANWVDKEVAVDGNLITSRNPDDIAAFNSKLIEKLSEIVK